jgi:mycothiol system anti-sigma-R factor
MNCRECDERLERYVDRELSASEISQVKQHLDHCPPCERRYEFHDELKRVIRVCCGTERAPDALREKLRQILF